MRVEGREFVVEGSRTLSFDAGLASISYTWFGFGLGFEVRTRGLYYVGSRRHPRDTAVLREVRHNLAHVTGYRVPCPGFSVEHFGCEILGRIVGEV